MYDDPGGDDGYAVDYEETAGTGMLGATLRKVGIIIAIGLGIVWLTGELGVGETGTVITAGAGQQAGTGIDEDGLVQIAEFTGDEILIPPGPRGHFTVELAVNGTPVRFLVDTGATMVSLTAEDAQRVGLPVHALDYSARAFTANGEIRIAPVILRHIQLGDREIRDVKATVTQAPLNISLLGMSFLRRLSSYEVSAGGLILRY